MKLYTEEQVRQSYKNGNLDGFSNVSYLDMCIDTLTPIKIPSDEEIENQTDIGCLIIYTYVFKEGAKWMKEQILNQNK